MMWCAMVLVIMAGEIALWAKRHSLSARTRSSLYLIAAVLFLIAMACASSVYAADIRVPDVDARMRLLVEQAVADEWGVDGSAARLAAQMHQESSWNPQAHSLVGAEGLAQMMPATGKWLAGQFPQLGTYDPWDPAWSSHAAAVYDHWLLVRNPGANACSSWAFALSSYNGGEGMLHREQRLARFAGSSPALWFGNTALYRSRSQAAWNENRGYVHRILQLLEPAYINAGWSGQAVCA